MNALKQELIDDLVTDVVGAIGAPPSRRLDREDLVQTAQLAVLEARLEMPHLDPDHDAGYLRWRIKQAIDEDLGISNREPATTLDLADVEGDRGLIAHDVGDEVVERAAAADQVKRMLAGVPADTADVVRLVFGLGGGQPIEPMDVADVLDLPPDEVEGHLWVAERALPPLGRGSPPSPPPSPDRPRVPSLSRGRRSGLVRPPRPQPQQRCAQRL